MQQRLSMLVNIHITNYKVFYMHITYLDNLVSMCIRVRVSQVRMYVYIFLYTKIKKNVG